MSAPTPSDPSWPAQRGISRGTLGLLAHALLQALLLPLRLLWGALTAGRQRRRIRQCIEDSEGS